MFPRWINELILSNINIKSVILVPLASEIQRVVPVLSMKMVRFNCYPIRIKMFFIKYIFNINKEVVPIIPYIFVDEDDYNG